MSPLAFEVANRGELIIPCPLVSRGRPTYSSHATVSITSPVPGEGPWLAVHAGVGPAKLLVICAATAGTPPERLTTIPSAYTIETSPSSTNGRDGQWRHELSVEQNTAATRAHVIEFDGQSWVRLTLAGEPTSAALPFGGLALHDASDGTDDCWLILGDSHLAGERTWAELVNERYPGYFPALIDETRLDESPARTAERLTQLLATHSAAKRVAIAHGPASIPSSDAAAALDAMVATVLQSGRLPFLARSPSTPGRARDESDAFNRHIAALEQRHRLVPGPDLAAWFDTHPDQLDADGQPNLEGRHAIARLWADAVDLWYVPQ